LDTRDVNYRDKILGLTQIAFLNALILSFLGVQFVIPFASIVLLIVIPVIFALQVYHVAIRLVFLSGLTVVILSSILFGVVLGIWNLVYFALGIALGWSCRKRIPIGLRLFMVSLLFCISLIVLIVAFGWMADINWADITIAITRYKPLNQLPLIPVMGIGLLGWAFLNTFGADRILSRVLKQLYFV
jgi:hypothetical protein